MVKGVSSILRVGGVGVVSLLIGFATIKVKWRKLRGDREANNDIFQEQNDKLFLITSNRPRALLFLF